MSNLSPQQQELLERFKESDTVCAKAYAIYKQSFDPVGLNWTAYRQAHHASVKRMSDCMKAKFNPYDYFKP
jgi:hypothetical protein